MSFAWPWALLALPLPLLWIRWRRHRQGDRTPSPADAAVRLPPRLRDALDELVRADRRGVDFDRWLLWVAWFGVVVTLAQPSSPGATTVQPVSGRALALVVDLSSSMEREDFTLDGKSSDRLGVVKRVVGDFVEKRRGDRVGLVLFGKQAFVASSPTFDLIALRSVLDGAGIGMAGRSTAIGDALGLALQSLRDDPAEHKAVLLLSDGTNNAGSVEPESAAALAATLGVRVHTIALGSGTATRGGLRTAVAADLDEATLEAISTTSGGRFFRAASTVDLQAIYNELDRLERAATLAPPIILARDWRHVPAMLSLLPLLTLVARQRRQA